MSCVHLCVCVCVSVCVSVCVCVCVCVCKMLTQKGFPALKKIHDKDRLERVQPGKQPVWE